MEWEIRTDGTGWHPLVANTIEAAQEAVEIRLLTGGQVPARATFEWMRDAKTGALIVAVVGQNGVRTGDYGAIKWSGDQA